jgi:hypothetical protein
MDAKITLGRSTRPQSVSMFHVTLLSNFARAFDKYKRLYRKSAIPQSTYPNEFYVLPRSELPLGAAKAMRLRDKLAIPGDVLIALEASLTEANVKPNLRSGIGFIWPSPDLPVRNLYEVGESGQLAGRLSLEDAMARSLALHARSFLPYADLKPRSLSFLPIAQGCQASCPFCFSESSASFEQKQTRLNWECVQRWVDTAYGNGAERAVITGGGEPTLLRSADLVQLIRICRTRFGKVVLITNGVKFAMMDGVIAHLSELHDAGLSVLAISRHHLSETVNARLMNLETDTPALLQVCADNSETFHGLRRRLICVLQQGGVETVRDIDEYVEWATSFGVEEVCFKELYVSTSHESVYHSHRANVWSAKNQVPLSLVGDWAEEKGFEIVSRLPWGAPIFAGIMRGKLVRVAAYTEPSLFWERSNNIARSWNVMADGTCIASLEDRGSVITPNTVGHV